MGLLSRKKAPAKPGAQKRFTEPVAVSSTAPAGFPTWPCRLPVRPSDGASTYSRSVLRASSNLGHPWGSDKTFPEGECRKERKVPPPADAYATLCPGLAT